MTREEFIDGYLSRSGLQDSVRSRDGFWIGRHRKIVIACSCGQTKCDGWAALSVDALPDHLLSYAPEPLRAEYLKALGK